MNKELVLIPTEIIERKIFLIRGNKVMLDSELAFLYKVPTKRLNEAVKRNRKRFPNDFMFQLNKQEIKDLKFQIGIPNLKSQFATSSYGGRRTHPYVFTEQGVAMLSSVLKSERAVKVNIAIMRAFVRLREIMGTHKDLARKIEDLEKKYNNHDKDILLIFQAIKKLISSPAPKPIDEPPKEPLGFRDRSKDKKS
jgi:hypothetical protein